MKTKPVAGIYCLVILLVIGIQTGMAEEPTSYLALIVEIAGDVFIQPKDTKELIKGRWGNYLYQGDFIKTGPNSHVSLLFSEGTMIELSENSQISIKQHPGGSPSERTTIANEKEKIVPLLDFLQVKSLPFQKPEKTIAKDGSERLYPSIRGAVDTTLLYPRATTIISLQPEFRWTSPYQDAKYKLTLSEESHVFAVYETYQTQFKIPDKLNWGKKYKWTVEISHRLKTVGNIASSGFTVIEKAKFEEYQSLLQKVNKLNLQDRDPNYYHFIMGYAYLKYDLRDEAVKHYEQIAEQNPASPFAHEALSRLYYDQKFFEKSRREYQTWCHLLKAKSSQGESTSVIPHE